MFWSSDCYPKHIARGKAENISVYSYNNSKNSFQIWICFNLKYLDLSLSLSPPPPSLSLSPPPLSLFKPEVLVISVTLAVGKINAYRGPASKWVKRWVWFGWKKYKMLPLSISNVLNHYILLLEWIRSHGAILISPLEKHRYKWTCKAAVSWSLSEVLSFFLFFLYYSFSFSLLFVSITVLCLIF